MMMFKLNKNWLLYAFSSFFMLLSLSFLFLIPSFKMIEVTTGKAEELYSMRESWLIVKAESILYLTSQKSDQDRKRFIFYVTQFDKNIEYLLDEQVFTLIEKNFTTVHENQAIFLKNWQDIQMKLVQVVNGTVSIEELADNVFWITSSTLDFNIVIDSLIKASNRFNKNVFKQFLFYLYILSFSVIIIFFLFILKNAELVHAKKAETRIRNLSQSLDSIRDNERKRIAIDLHDSLIHKLASIKNYCRPDLISESTNVSETLNTISDEIDNAIRVTRDISFNLRPVELKKDFLSAVQYFLTDFSEKNSIKINFICYGFNNIKFTEEIEIPIFRMIQEILNNTVRHSGASDVFIKLIYSFPYIILNTGDNGIGIKNFDIHNNNIEKNHMGIKGIIDRVELLNGIINIKSRDQMGVKFYIKIPYTVKMDKQGLNNVKECSDS